MPASEGVGDNPRVGSGGRLVGNGVEDGVADGEFGGRLLLIFQERPAPTEASVV